MSEQSMAWKTLSSEYISRHPYFTARKDKCETPEGKIIPEYFVVELPQSVCAVAITNVEEVLMVRQYRQPIHEAILELPGGFVDDGEEPYTSMQRELREETGFYFKNIIPLGKVAANPGVLNNYTHLFLATGGEAQGPQKLDAHEYLEVEKISIPQLKKLFLENKIVQSLHNNCIFYALHHLGKL